MNPKKIVFIRQCAFMFDYSRSGCSACHANRAHWKVKEEPARTCMMKQLYDKENVSEKRRIYPCISCGNVSGASPKGVAVLLDAPVGLLKNPQQMGITR